MEFTKHFTLLVLIFNIFATQSLHTSATDLPGPSTITHYPSTAIKNSELIVTCNTKYLGKPPANKYRWHSNGVEQADLTSKKIHIKNISARVTNFTCAAVNEVGSGESGHITITVLAPPMFISRLPASFGVLDKATSVSLTCEVECSPTCLVFWLKDEQILTNNNPLYHMRVDVAGPNYEANVVGSVISTLSFNLTSWPDGHLRKEVDDATYSCKSTSNGINRGVTSSTEFRVEYPPENIVLSRKEVNVTEWSILYNITCNADGLPEPSYLWTYNDKVLSSYKFLYTNYPISRNDSGNYKCTASNRHGSASSAVLINVMYKPTCEIVKTEKKNKVVLTCKVNDANPQDIIYKWLLDNEAPTEDISEEGTTLSFLKEKIDLFYGNITCAVSNYVGESNCILTLMSTEKDKQIVSETNTQHENELDRSENDLETTVTEPERTVTEPETTVTEPEKTLTGPERSETEPEPERSETEPEPEGTVTEPEGTVIEPERTVTEPERTVTEPERTVTEPERSEIEPETSETQSESDESKPQTNVKDKGSSALSSKKNKATKIASWLNNATILIFLQVLLLLLKM